ncbi:MAG: peptidase domain-containing ABC transporter [Bacilli bacterium]|jgi:ABC-type bacteriocin/lantibiotic exporter with double-glycine peptidase domain
MKKRPKVILQSNINDCGLVCLVILTKFYGGNVSVEELKRIIKITPQGISAYHLIEVAKKIGFLAKGYRCSDDQQIPFPSIAHVLLDKVYFHYVIIEDINYQQKKIMIIDPAVGRKELSLSQFKEIWTEIVISLEPTSNLKKKNYSKIYWNFLLGLIKPEKKRILIIFLLSLITFLFSLINNWYLKLISDNVFSTVKQLKSLLSFFLLIVLIRIISGYIRGEIIIKLNKRIDEKLLINTYRRFLSLPYRYYHQHQTGDIVSKLNDLNFIRDFISSVSVVLFIDIVIFLVFFFLLYFINQILFSISLLILIIYLFIVAFFHKRLNNYINQKQKLRALINSYLYETISNIETVKGLNIEEEMLLNLSKKQELNLKNNYSLEKLFNLQSNLKDLVVLIGLNVILFGGSFLLWKKMITIGDLLLFYTLVIFFLEPIRNIVELEPLIKSAYSSFKRIGEIYEIKPENLKVNEISLRGNISFKNLEFSFDDLKNVLNKFNLKIKKGQKILISGPSGSGKSTLFKLLNKYYEDYSGQIKIDDYEIKDLSLKTIRDNICYVSQKERLFTETIYNNIVLNRTIPLKKLEEVSQVTMIEEFLKKKNLDYNYLIEERGENLAGGERQQIIIARTLLKQVNVYIFDESMNEMDLKFERRILLNIFKYLHDKTVIVISHRLDNKDLYDEIIMMKKERS